MAFAELIPFGRLFSGRHNLRPGVGDMVPKMRCIIRQTLFAYRGFSLPHILLFGGFPAFHYPFTGVRGDFQLYRDSFRPSKFFGIALEETMY